LKIKLNTKFKKKIEYFIPHFKRLGITAVIRLNDPLYEAERFVQEGIDHYDLIFPDGHNPPDHILNKFLRICATQKGGIAIHCMAGLGNLINLIFDNKSK